MAPKEAGKKPAGKAPAKTAEKKASKDGKKRKVTRKETFNTYIYKVFLIRLNKGIETSASRHWYLQQGNVYSQLFCE